MKENRQWKKRLFGMLLAFAMVLTQVGVWNAGIESVQAAEKDSFTLYYYNESEEPLYGTGPVFLCGGKQSGFHVRMGQAAGKDGSRGRK